MKRTALAAAILAATSAAADEPDQTIPHTQNHAVQQMFWFAPCTETVALIDGAAPKDLGLDATISFLARQSMAWGHLLGFESAHPGIKGEHPTILQRLRKDCAGNIESTAMELLEGYRDEPGQ